MTTIQTYECPLHGLMEVPISGDAPDDVVCPHYTQANTPCPHMADWRISAPSVSTPDSHARAMRDLVRTSNPL